MKIITVFKTHVDIGFTDLPQNVIEKYSTNMLADAIETCEKTAGFDKAHRFVWTLPSFPLYHALRTADSEVIKRCEKVIENDQLKWHALPFTLRTEFFNKDELTHCLNYAKELSARFNKPMPIAAKMTDVPGHTQGLVDVLCENGIKFLHLGCNPASTTPNVPTLFWWESKNGNRILTYYNKNYGSSILPPDNWKYPVHLAMIQTNDNCGVQSYTVIEELEKEALEAYPNAQFTTGTLDDFATEILKCDLSDLPVIRGELGDSWIHCLGAFPESVAAVREAREIFGSLDEDASIGENPKYKALKEEYYENGLLLGEHSGGVDTKKYLAFRVYEKSELKKAIESESYKYANEGWNQERAWGFKCLEVAKEAKRLFGKETKEAPTCVENNKWRLYVENDLIRAQNRQSGEIITFNYLYEIIGKERMEQYLNDYLRLKVDWSIEDFGRKNYPNCEDKEYGLVLKCSEICEDKITAKYTVPSESVALYGNAKELTVTAKILDEKVLVNLEILEKEPTTYIEGGHFIIELTRPFEKIRVQKSGVEIDPDCDVVLGANRGLFATDKYVKVNETVIKPIHTPLVSFGGSKIYRFSCGDIKQSKTPKVYFNLFNTMWGTGNPQWITGSYSFDFEIEAEK